MCRLLAVYGSLRELAPHYPSLIDGIVKAARRDPYLARFTGGSRESHRDGWGRVSVVVGGDYTAVTYYRSLAPIFVDEPTPAPPVRAAANEDVLVFDLVHARAASRGMKVNIYSVQPFEYQTRTGSRLFVIHNGSVDKEGLAVELEASRRVGLDEYSDTYVMGLWLSERLGDEINLRVVGELKGYVGTALNIGLILLAPGRVQLLIGSYYKSRGLDAEEYYRVYAKRLDSGLVAASSTIIEKYRPGTLEFTRDDILPNGGYVLVDVELPVRDKPVARVTASSF